VFLDLLVKLVFAGVAAVLTPFVIQAWTSPIAYVWLISMLLLVVLVVRDYRGYRDRPFSKRYRNEEAATPAITDMLAETRTKLCVLSKVGTWLCTIYAGNPCIFVQAPFLHKNAPPGYGAFPA
jgi:hypothetical protein